MVDNECNKPHNLGKWAENEALVYLQSQGLKLIERNYHAICGEIDLIMQDKSSIAFIEVRYRANNRFGNAAESIDKTKQLRITLTSQQYLQNFRTPADTEFRFDVVAISGLPGKPEIEWIKNAFQA